MSKVELYENLSSDLFEVVDKYSRLFGENLEQNEILQQIYEVANEAESYEECDRCRKLVERKDSIELELVNVLLCKSCHMDHKGIAVYW